MINNKLKIIDIFAGAGGFGLGFEMAGFDVIGSLEIDKWACDTLNKNNKNVNHKVIQGDIRDYYDYMTIRKIFLDTPDILIGGPPCQGFSHARGSFDTNDPRNSLFKNFVQWVDILQPKVFVMENVLGILSRKLLNGTNVIDVIKRSFEEVGYSVEIWVLNAAEYGVPQLRQRVFIVGNNLNLIFSKPTPTHSLINVNDNSLKPSINVWDAISDLPLIYAKQGNEVQDYIKTPLTEYQKWSRHNSEKVYNHVAMNHTDNMVERFKAIQEGTTVAELPEKLRVKKRNGNGLLSDVNFNQNYRHLKEDMVSYTIPASFYSNFIHPNIPRNITSREAARLQSFPDNYIFEGKRTMMSSKLLKRLGKEDYLSQYNQIGNAVPPLLAKAIALHLKSKLAFQPKKESMDSSIEKVVCESV